MKYRCINEFQLEIYDEHGIYTGEYKTIPAGTIWELNKSADYIGGEVHLDHADGSWIETSRNILEKFFVEIGGSDSNER